MGASKLTKKPSPAWEVDIARCASPDHEVVDEESIFALIKGDLLIRHGFAVRSWLANSTSHAGEGFGLCDQSAC